MHDVCRHVAIIGIDVGGAAAALLSAAMHDESVCRTVKQMTCHRSGRRGR
jgi:hypothetical protein